MPDKCPGKMGTLGIDRAFTQTNSQIKLRQSGRQNRAPCFATFLQNQLKSNVARFTAPLRNSTTLYFRQPRFQRNLQQTWFAARQVLFVNGKTPNIAMQLVFRPVSTQVALFRCPLFEMNILTLSQEREKEDRAHSLKIISSFAIPVMAPYFCRFRAYH